MAKNNDNPLLRPLFDTSEFIKEQMLPATYTESYQQEDFIQAKSFLLNYIHVETTFNAYRREIERFLHWLWLIANKSFRVLKRVDIEAYIEFCQDPPLDWIGIKKVPRFIETGAKRQPNSAWRPFVATVTKSEHRDGKLPNIKKYILSPKALREIFTIIGSFYNFLIQEEYAEINPVLQIRQKSRYFRKTQGKPKIRRLSELQWNYVIETAGMMAQENPELHERTRFMLSALYGMYLRISELAASDRWMPKMEDFYSDADGLWWFITVGKGNKERHIAVSDHMLEALRRYRTYLNLTPLPIIGDKNPLFPKTLGKGAISSISYIRKVVQGCFDRSIERLKSDDFHDEAAAMQAATVHWLRHTGISEDVKRRPREHVRDDAGHSSSAITDKYIDIELRERHASARKKVIQE
jgi:site-specific recombinase XerD